MLQLFDAVLDGDTLSLIAPEIVVTDIEEAAAQMETKTVPLAMGDGLLRTHNRRKSLTVRIRCAICTQDVARRAAVRDLVAAWACRGGVLRINTRPDKHLHVVCDTAPNQGSGMRWTNEIEINLVAYAVPFWENDTETALTVTTAAESGEYRFSGSIRPTGTAQTAPVCFEGTANAALDRLKITAGETFFDLASIGANSGDKIAVGYGADGLLYIRKESGGETVSLLPMRTPESSDDLLAKPGAVNQVSVVADAAITGKIKCRGRWV